MSTPGKIDVHHHVYPRVFTEALQNNGGDPSGWYIPPWTEALDDDMCAKHGISTAILSCTAPAADHTTIVQQSASLSIAARILVIGETWRVRTRIT